MRGARHGRHGRRSVLQALAAFAAAALFVLAGGLPAQAAPGDRIESYDITYRLDAQGVLHGTERLRYHFGGGSERHGIDVYWPVRIQEKNANRYRYYDLQVTGVSSPSGAAADYQVSDDGSLRGVRIGSKNATVSGTQTYEIRYTVEGTVNPVDGAQELYVNPVGTAWQVPIEKVSFRLDTPQGATRTACYSGPRGSTDAGTCRLTQDGDSLRATASGLGDRRGLSVLAAYPAGMIPNAAPVFRNGDADAGPGIGDDMPVPLAQGLSIVGYGAAVLVPVATLLLVGSVYRRRGRDEYATDVARGIVPDAGSGFSGARDGRGTRGAQGTPPAPATARGGRRGPIAVRFEPPEGGRPGLIGTLVDQSADTLDVSATVIDLAVRGHLVIEETRGGKDPEWLLRRTENPPTGDLLPYEQTVLDGIFFSGPEVFLSDLKNHFAPTLERVKDQMYRQTVDDGWFRVSPAATRANWRNGALRLLVLGAAVFMGTLFFAGASVEARAGIGVPIPAGVALGVGLGVAALIVFLLGRKMPARTAVGSAINEQAAGFRLYLETAEAEQIRFEEASSIFGRYLPYAIVFGCADRWAKVFNQVAESAQAQGYALDMPTWYLFYGHPTFVSFDGITGGLDSFSTISSDAFTSTPGSSGSSGFSSGGGFSGGGGFGGGGGGSW